MRYLVGFVVGAVVGAFVVGTSKALPAAIAEHQAAMTAAAAGSAAERDALAAKMKAMGVNVGAPAAS